MSSTSFSKEQHLLIASGVLAVLVVAWLIHAYLASPVGLSLTAVFGLAFLCSSYGKRLRIAPRIIALCIPVMLLLSLGLLALLRDTSILILSVVLMASAPYQLTSRQSVLLFIVANTGYLAIVISGGVNEATLTAWVSLFALQGFALSSSLARTRETRAQEELERQNNELRAARALIAHKSQVQERLRIAGDLHDSIGHGLTALRLQLEALAHQAPEELRGKLATTQALAAELLEELRSIVRQASASQRRDFAEVLRELAQLTPEVHIEISPALPAATGELAQQLVFCIQEGIHNAIRHGGATAIHIVETPTGLLLRDNGRGLHRGPVVAGFGLENINQRLKPFGGRAQLLAASTASKNGGCELRMDFAAAETWT